VLFSTHQKTKFAHKKLSPKGSFNPFGEALFFANFNNGALKTAPYGTFYTI
jgi:hypothetical protein